MRITSNESHPQDAASKGLKKNEEDEGEDYDNLQLHSLFIVIPPSLYNVLISLSTLIYQYQL